MAEAPEPIDISQIPELVRIVNEANTTNQSVVLEEGNNPVAVLVPVGLAGLDIPEALSAAGSWAGLVDGEKLKERLRAERGSDRTPPSL